MGSYQVTASEESYQVTASEESYQVNEATGMDVLAASFDFMYDFADPTVNEYGYITKVESLSGVDYLIPASGSVAKGYNCIRANDHSYLKANVKGAQDLGTNNLYFIVQFSSYPHTRDIIWSFFYMGSGYYFQYRENTNALFFYVKVGSTAKYIQKSITKQNFSDGSKHIVEVIWTRPNNPTIYMDGIDIGATGTIDWTNTDSVTSQNVNTTFGSATTTATSFWGLLSFVGIKNGSISAANRTTINDILNARSLDTWKTRTLLSIPYKVHSSLFTAVVGNAFTIYKNSFINQEIDIDVEVVFTCDVGITDVNGDFAYTPIVVDVGSHDLTFTIYDTDGNIIDAGVATLSVIAGENGSGTKKILMVGDSLTDSKVIWYDQALSVVLDHLTLNYIGTRLDTHTVDKYHEGYTGKTYTWMVDHADSPFTKSGALDVNAYFTDNGVDTPDFVHIQLGTNDVFSYNTKMTYDELYTIIDDAKELVDAFLSYDANLKIIINMPPSLINDSIVWESVYGSKDSSIVMYNMMLLRQAMCATFDYVTYNARVSVVYGGLFIDRDNDFANGVHPSSDKYYKIGNAIAYEIDRLLS